MGQDIEQETEAYAVAVPAKSPVMAPPGSSVVTAPPGATTVAVPVGSSSDIPMWQQPKQGAKCCGCCCDYRRAVIVIAIITICVSIGTIILVVASATYPTASVQVDDDAVLAIYDDSLVTQAIFSGVSLACSICALVGANKYNIYLVGINCLWYVGNFIAGTIINIQTADEMSSVYDDDTVVTVSFIPTIITSAILTALFMYPHIGFIYEVKSGIMSYETYPREEYSCCCAPSARRG